MTWLRYTVTHTHTYTITSYTPPPSCTSTPPLSSPPIPFQLHFLLFVLPPLPPPHLPNSSPHSSIPPLPSPHASQPTIEDNHKWIQTQTSVRCYGDASTLPLQDHSSDQAHLKGLWTQGSSAHTTQNTQMAQCARYYHSHTVYVRTYVLHHHSQSHCLDGHSSLPTYLRIWSATSYREIVMHTTHLHTSFHTL